MLVLIHPPGNDALTQPNDLLAPLHEATLPVRFRCCTSLIAQLSLTAQPLPVAKAQPQPHQRSGAEVSCSRNML